MRASWTERLAGGSSPPWGLWAALSLVAVSGSLAFGAAVARSTGAFELSGGALWLTISAGLSWPVLFAAVVRVLRVPALAAAHACLVAMAWGEVVLLLGAAVTLGFGLSGGAAVGSSAVAVAISNGAMAVELARQLGALGVSLRRTVGVWMLFLNGTGALLFGALYGVFAR